MQACAPPAGAGPSAERIAKVPRRRRERNRCPARRVTPASRAHPCECQRRLDSSRSRPDKHNEQKQCQYVVALRRTGPEARVQDLSRLTARDGFRSSSTQPGDQYHIWPSWTNLITFTLDVFRLISANPLLALNVYPFCSLCREFVTTRVRPPRPHNPTTTYCVGFSLPASPRPFLCLCRIDTLCTLIEMRVGVQGGACVGVCFCACMYLFFRFFASLFLLGSG